MTKLGVTKWAAVLGLSLPLFSIACGGDDSAAADGGGSDVPVKTDFPDWATYGGDAENHRNNTTETKLTTATVKNLTKVWSFDDAPVTSTPTLYAGVLYFADWEGKVHAVQPETGKQVWVAKVKDQVNNTLCVTKDTVFVGTAGTSMFALDRKTGDVVWGPKKLETVSGAQIWSSPQVFDGMLILGTASFQVFLGDSTTGKGSVIALDTKTGEKMWQTYMTTADATSGAGVSVWSSPAIDAKRKMIYIGSGQTYHAPASKLADSIVALDAETGDVKWNVQFTKDDIFTSTMSPGGKDYDVGATPNLFSIGTRDVVGAGDKKGHYYVLDRDTGEMVWERELTPGSNRGGVMATAAYADGIVYVASNDGSTGGIPGPASGPMEQTTFALDAATGDIKWMASLKPATYGAVSIANGVLYVPTIDATLHALDAKTGDELFTDTQGDSGASGPTISNGMVFMGNGWQWLPSGSMKGGLTAYGLPAK